MSSIVVCSFYTDDEYYRNEAKALKAELDKLGVDSRTAAVAVAVERGIAKGDSPLKRWCTVEAELIRWPRRAPTAAGRAGSRCR